MYVLVNLFFFFFSIQIVQYIVCFYLSWTWSYIKRWSCIFYAILPMKNMLLILFRGIFGILSHSFVRVSLCIFIRMPMLAKKLIVMCLTIYANYFKSFYSAELLNISIFHISQLDLFDFIIYSNGFRNIFNIDICAFYFVDGKWKSMEICTLFIKMYEHSIFY